MQNHGLSSVSNPNTLPPSPPLRPDLGFDDVHQSPSAASSHSSAAAVPYFGSAINNIEPHQQRQPASALPHSGNPMPPPASPSPYQTSPYSQSSVMMSNYPYPSTALPGTGTPSMYYQQSLPSSFPSAGIPTTITPTGPNPHEASPIDHHHPWQQHHHYISPSSSAAFANQSQDRYVCQTCSKAFSRPSSLRIHSHSHTGEKPFRCPHAGCGKAFSVRSNMKRHERGCHGGESPGSG